MIPEKNPSNQMKRDDFHHKQRAKTRCTLASVSASCAFCGEVDIELHRGVGLLPLQGGLHQWLSLIFALMVVKYIVYLMYLPLQNPPKK